MPASCGGLRVIQNQPTAITASAISATIAAPCSRNPRAGAAGLPFDSLSVMGDNPGGMRAHIEPDIRAFVAPACAKVQRVSPRPSVHEHETADNEERVAGQRENRRNDGAAERAFAGPRAREHGGEFRAETADDKTGAEHDHDLPPALEHVEGDGGVLPH